MTTEDTRARERVDNVGAWKLRNLPRSLKQIAKDLGAKYVVVAQWAEGRRRPSGEWPETLHTYSLRWGGKLEILVEDWKTRLSEVKRAKKGRTKKGLVADLEAKAPPTTTPEQVLDEAGKLIRDVQSLRDEVSKPQGEEEYGPSVSERAKILSQCAVMLDKAARLTGASAEISPAKILRSPGWNKIKHALAESLEPWPDAMRSVAEAIKKMVET